MAKPAKDEWVAHEHAPIEKLTENVWRVDGSVPGMTLRRNMIVAKLADGRLVVHSAISMDEASMKELEAWGTPAFLVVPNAFHRLDAPRYKKRYPELKVLAPKGSRKKVEDLIAVDGVFEDFPKDDEVKLQHLPGVGDGEGVMRVRSKDGDTLVLNDCMFNMDPKKDFLGWLITSVMGSAPGPRVSRLAKLALVKDKKALRGAFEGFAAEGTLKRLVVAHEKLVTGEECASALLQASTYL